MKYRIFNKKSLIIAAVIFIAAGASITGLTHADFLGGMVKAELEKAIAKELNAKLEMSPMSGNPITGFEGRSVTVTRSGEKLLSIENIKIRLSLPSLIKNSPRISAFIINGLNTDYDSLNRLIPKKESSGAKDIPIDKVKINNTKIASKWGLLELDKSSVEIRGSEWYAPALKGLIQGTPFTMSGICKKNDGTWTLDGFSLKLENGTVKLSGAVYPVPAFTSEMKDLNLNKVVSLVPELAKYGIRGIFSGTCNIDGMGHDMVMNGKGTLKDALLRGIPLSEVTAEWSYDKGLVKVEIPEGKIFKSSLSGKMELDTRSKERYLDFKANAENLDFADWTDKVPASMAGNALFLQGGITSLKADLKGPVDALVGQVEITPSNIRYDNIEFTELQGTAKFEGKPSGLVDFYAMHHGNKVTLNGTLSFADNVPTKLMVNAESLQLNGLGETVPALKKYSLNGTADVSAVIEGLIGNWQMRADISSPSMQVEKIGTLKNIKATPEYYFKERSFVLKNVSGVWNDAQVAGSGIAKPAGGDMMLSFKGTFKNVSAEKFYSIVPFFKSMNVAANASGTWAVAGTAKSPSVTAVVNTARSRFRKLAVDKFSSRIIYSPGLLKIDPMNIAASGGTANMKCNVVLPAEGTDTPVKWEVFGRVREVDLSVLNGLMDTEQDIKGPCTGDIRVSDSGDGLKWSADLADCNVKWKEYAAEDARGTIKGDADKIELKGLRVKSLKGEHDVKGKITFAGSGKPMSDAKLDLVVASKKINMYELIRRHLPVVRGVQGLIKSTVSVGGTIGSPSYKGEASLSPFRYRGFLLPTLDVAFNGNLTAVNVPTAVTKLKDGKISGSGKAYMKDGVWFAEINTGGSNIDLNQLGAYMPEKFRQGLGGITNFRFKGKGKVTNFQGEGTFSSKSMRFMGISISNVNAPFYITEGYALMEDVKAETNGGTVSGGLALNLAKSTWGGNMTILNADVQSSLKQLMPGLKGKITGKADFKVRAGGETGRMSTVKASGALFMRNGEISEFAAVEAARKYTKGKPLLYKTVQSAFSYDGGDLSILPGSQVVAPAKDTVYRYIMIDGLINKDQKMGLFAMGKVNIQALNAFLGALQGLIKTGMDFTGTLDTTTLLQNFLGGVLSGFTRSDFRFVTMNIGGTVTSPSFNNIKVDTGRDAKQGSDVIPKSASDPEDDDTKSGNTTIRLKFEIPVGPGMDKSSGHVGGEVLGNILQDKGTQ